MRHLLDPCSQNAAGVLQACQGDVHAEDLVGSLGPTLSRSEATPAASQAMLLPANPREAAGSGAVAGRLPPPGPLPHARPPCRRHAFPLAPASVSLREGQLARVARDAGPQGTASAWRPLWSRPGSSGK